MKNPRLPVSITGSNSDLSQSAQMEINDLRGARPWNAARVLLLTWLEIFSAIAIALWADQHWVTLLTIFFVATRQNKLGLMTHEQSHRLAFPGKWGNLLVNLIASYPLLFFSVESYGQLHLMHHRSYFSKNDPDFLRKSGKDWTFPMSRWRLAKLFLKDISGLSAIEMARGKNAKTVNGPNLVSNPTPTGIRPTYYLAVGVILTATHSWTTFFLFWLVPMVTVLAAIVRWGAICEHEYNIEGASVRDTTPIIIPAWYEQLLLPNLNFGFHTYHHYYPNVAFCKLPELHRIFEKEGLVNQDGVFYSHLSYLRFLTDSRYWVDEQDRSTPTSVPQ